MRPLIAAASIAFAAAAMQPPASFAQSAQTAGGTAQPEPIGGYAPPPVPPPPPDAIVHFQPSVSPSVAFPPPAPLDHYPVCRKGQFDKCVQRERGK